MVGTSQVVPAPDSGLSTVVPRSQFLPRDLLPWVPSRVPPVVDPTFEHTSCVPVLVLVVSTPKTCPGPVPHLRQDSGSPTSSPGPRWDTRSETHVFVLQITAHTHPRLNH